MFVPNNMINNPNNVSSRVHPIYGNRYA
jgi:hypothetical protein